MIRFIVDQSERRYGATESSNKMPLSLKDGSIPRYTIGCPITSAPTKFEEYLDSM